MSFHHFDATFPKILQKTLSELGHHPHFETCFAYIISTILLKLTIRRRSKTGEKWHLDEVFPKINGKTDYLWRAVDQYGNVLDILVQSRRHKHAAQKFFRKLLKGLHYVLWVIITDKLASYAAAKKDIMPGVEHRQHKGLNNRAERSHQPTRQRERSMRRFKSPGHAQRFLSAFGPILDHFQPKRHRLAAEDYHTLMRDRFVVWNEVTSLKRIKRELSVRATFDVPRS